jgi:signal transduction histidine kinase
LQIVRTLVLTELNGRLQIEPRPGGGTRVLVELPLGEPALDGSGLAATALEESSAGAL